MKSNIRVNELAFKMLKQMDPMVMRDGRTPDGLIKIKFSDKTLERLYSENAKLKDRLKKADKENRSKKKTLRKVMIAIAEELNREDYES